mmetsp:Transcript_26277/g.73782  ORF Transcript_26277/g.73782 Transcript_26277/m.73782 type:complete len:100 (-) Transcript_26277:36-335(-)
MLWACKRDCDKGVTSHRADASHAPARRGPRKTVVESLIRHVRTPGRSRSSAMGARMRRCGGGSPQALRALDLGEVLGDAEDLALAFALVFRRCDRFLKT